MMSALPPVVTEATAFALSLTAIIGALALVSRLRPIRYVWRQLVSKPLAAWASSVIREGVLQFHLAEIAPQIEAIQKELTLNGGSTLRDEVVATRLPSKPWTSADGRQLLQASRCQGKVIRHERSCT